MIFWYFVKLNLKHCCGGHNKLIDCQPWIKKTKIVCTFTPNLVAYDTAFNAFTIYMKYKANPSQHTASGAHRLASETPFEWRFARGPMVARFYIFTGALLLKQNHTLKRSSAANFTWQFKG